MRILKKKKKLNRNKEQRHRTVVLSLSHLSINFTNALTIRLHQLNYIDSGIKELIVWWFVLFRAKHNQFYAWINYVVCGVYKQQMRRFYCYANNSSTSLRRRHHNSIYNFVICNSAVWMSVEWWVILEYVWIYESIDFWTEN